MRDEKPYQLALVCGASTDVVAAVAETVVDLTPTGEADVVTEVLAALDRSGLSPADVRARALLFVDGDVTAALSTYAAVTGFAGRHIDVATLAGVIHMDRITVATSNRADIGRPEDRADVFQYGVVRDDMPSVPAVTGGDPLADVDAALLAQLRHARRARFVVPGALPDAFVGLAALCGARTVKGRERFPTLAATGFEHVPGEGVDDVIDGLVDLDQVRQTAGAKRRAIKSWDTSALAAPGEQTERQSMLVQAATIPVERVLAALGCANDGDLWQCPRPLSHNHGDMTPSMKVSDGKGRCYVDDSEWVDAVRLIMAVCAVTPDEAVTLLSGGPAGLAPYAEKIAADRAVRAAR